jgi:hypothetical protein
MVVRPGADSVVNGVPGAIGLENGKSHSLAAFTVVDGKIIAIDILADPERIARIDPAILEALPKIE